jgi:hypothetical protein
MHERSMYIQKNACIHTNMCTHTQVWVTCTVEMVRIHDSLRPYHEHLAEKRRDHDIVGAKYAELESRVRTLEARLGDVMASFQDATEEKNAALQKLDEMLASCGIAKRLAVGICLCMHICMLVCVCV